MNTIRIRTLRILRRLSTLRGEGTYYYKARAIEVDLGTDNETGNVSPWSDMSEGFEYKRPAKAATSFDIEIDYSDCNISGGRYLDFTKEKGYAVTVLYDAVLHFDL